MQTQKGFSMLGTSSTLQMRIQLLILINLFAETEETLCIVTALFVVL